MMKAELCFEELINLGSDTQMFCQYESNERIIDSQHGETCVGVFDMVAHSH